MSAARFGLLTYPGIHNLGDVIQSIAAKRFLPRVDLRIPRERISDDPGSDEPVALIANGWFMHKPSNWPPHPSIVPLPVSMHFAETDFGRFQRWRRRPVDRLLSGAGAEYLRHWGPVGARDQFTAEELSKRHIPSYVSGCLTATLVRPDSLPREDFIVACDLAPTELAELRRRTDREIVETSHIGRAFETHALQEAEAERVLALYARASAVVTSRIHAALPCLGFGTPVLLLVPGRADRRVADVAALTHSCSLEDFGCGRLEFDLRDPPANPDAFKAPAERLAAACHTFVEQWQAQNGRGS